ncbi:hypothetical protein [Actinomycetospora chiangmaiensis]|uniref:hypothetical protein n=1 Tax=Actinomycetospora chiangmaiensis TaxID=402650 RepID=UPI00035F800C|nr:hypothetical protein [Actinomycetospora chiangmaiensis]
MYPDHDDGAHPLGIDPADPDDPELTFPVPDPVEDEPLEVPLVLGGFGVNVAVCPLPPAPGAQAACTIPLPGSTATTAGENPTGVDPNELHEPSAERPRVVTVPAVWSAVSTCPVAGSNTVAIGPAPTGTDWVWV